MSGWEPSDRGVSFHFGADVLEAFLLKNSLSLLVRAHQVSSKQPILHQRKKISGFFLPLKVVEDGYEFFNRRSLVTLFSAPNYCGQFDNAGAIMSVGDDLTCSFTILPVIIITRVC